MTRRHLKGDEHNKAIRTSPRDDPRVLAELARNQAWLAKIQARDTVCDDEIHNERKTGS
jgi:glycine cleavage system H lipoate-binding protein